MIPTMMPCYETWEAPMWEAPTQVGPPKRPAAYSACEAPPPPSPPYVPVHFGPSKWPPECTPENQDPFQFKAPPDDGIPCCSGLTQCVEKRNPSYPGAGTFESVVVCRRGPCPE